MKSGTEILVPERMKCNNFDDPLPFNAVLSSSQNLNLSYDAKALT